MHIFIDESGSFQRSDRSKHSISCVTSVTIPGRHLADVERKLKELSTGWPRSASGEIKGRLLNESHVADLCGMLAPMHVILEASIMDMNLVTNDEIEFHRNKQAEGMTKNLTEQHHPNVVSAVWELRRLLEAMPLQLYAQAVSLTELVWKACEDGQLYFCQRYPGELGRFRWVIDAKDAQLTSYEKWWRDSVMGLIQAKSMKEPIIKLRGGDYSALYRSFPSQLVPSYLKPTKRREKADDVRGILGRELLFARSEDHIGLQIADVLANALRRACSGRLGAEGWRPVGQLLIHSKKGAVRPINLGFREGAIRAPYAATMNALNRMGRSMLVDDKPKARRRR